MNEHPHPTKEDALGYMRDHSNWGRWGADDQVGAVNLVTPEKRLQAISLVRTGQVVSLSREMPKTPAANNPTPALHYMRTNPRPGTDAGSIVDFYGTSYHGQSTTHLDALCHVYVDNQLYNGRNPDEVIGFDGAHWGAIQNWSTGIITRGVLLDVPKYRGVPSVTQETPVHGWELEAIAKAQGVEVQPGDALIVYSGREAWDRAGHVWGSGDSRPGLHISCMPYIRDRDVCVLVWDMMDHLPSEYGLPWQVHPVIPTYGVGLVDNALLEPLAAVCSEQNRYEFMLILAPLIMMGGTGSPLNPLVMF